jgi:hypothetical protein
MLQFVYSRTIQVLLVPVLCVPRQDYGRAQDATRHRPRQRFMQQHFDAPMNASIESERFDDRLPTSPRQARSAQRTKLPQTNHHREQKKRGSSGPTREQQIRQR